MIYAFLGLIVLASIGLAIYALINKSELVAQITALQREMQEQDADYSAEIEDLKTELAKLDKMKHIPNIIERSKKLEGRSRPNWRERRRKPMRLSLSHTRKSRRMKEQDRGSELRRLGRELIGKWFEQQVGRP